MAEALPFETRADLRNWLEGEGLGHLGRLNLEAAAPYVPEAWWPQLRQYGARRRLIDLASRDFLSRWHKEVPASPFRDALPQAVGRYIEAQRAELRAARADEATRTTPPSAEPLRPVFERLMALRRLFAPNTAPRLVLSLDDLKPDLTLPGFRFKDTLPSEMALRGAGTYARAEVTVALGRSNARVECTCGLSNCVHGFAAVDTVGRWLQQPVTAPVLDVVRALDEPPWVRTLKALDVALARPSAQSRPELWWHVQVLDERHVEVLPRVFGARPSAAKRQALSGPLLRQRLHLELGRHLTGADAKLLALLPDHGVAPKSLLEGLVDHPRVVLASDPDKAVRVERAALGLVADERHGAVQLSVGLEGTSLPAELAERVRRGKPDEPVFLWDEGPRRLTLLDAPHELREVLDVLDRDGTLFPQESHSALLESLSKWSQRVPVAMPRSVLGEAVPPTLTPVVRLSAKPHGSVEVELRIRPLAGATAVTPGEGARDVHVRRDGRAFHAVRDLTQERAAAEAWCRTWPLDEAEEVAHVPFAWHFSNAHRALELLDHCRKLVPPPEFEWVGQPIRVTGAVTPRALKVVIDHRRDWFGMLGHLSVEGERVELARLLDAARRQERYVQVEPHTYVELSVALREHLERLRPHVRSTNQGLEVGPSGGEAVRLLQADGASVDSPAAWRALTERMLAAAKLKPRVPKGLKAKLRSYQREGYVWLTRLAAWGVGGVLADDMGLGKTVQALAVLVDRQQRGPALVLAPTSVAFNWVDEARSKAPGLKVTVYSEVADREATLAALGPGDVLVASYGLLVRDAERLARTHFATLVCDEAQQLKNASTQRVRAARSLDADFRFALTGTPIENNLSELWALYAVVYPPLLGPWETFRQRFAVPIEKQNDPTAAPALAHVLEPFMLRRTKDGVEAQLPARTDVKVPVVLSAEEWQLYEDARLSALSDLETKKSVLREQQRRVEVLASLTRLRLLASHPKLYDRASALPSAKLTRLLELLEELRAENQRTLVFSQFTSHLALVQAALNERGIDWVYLDGATPAKERRSRITAFQEGHAPVFLISLKAGGFGVNLTAATNVIHLDPWWNPAVEDQASDRAHRLGQTKPVTVYRLVALGTIEEHMLALHASKRLLVSQVLAGKDQAARLSTDELLGLLARRAGHPEAEVGYLPGPSRTPIAS